MPDGVSILKAAMRLTLFFTPLLLATSTACAGQAPASMTVRLAQAEERQESPLIQYRVDLLTAALAADGVKASIVGCSKVDTSTADQRQAIHVRDNQGCDAIVTSAGGEITRGLAVVPFPIYLGGGGLRVLLMTPESLGKAPHPLNLDGLRRLSFGSGSTWADTQILEFNGLHVEKTPVYRQLFVQLRKQRFDALSRSIFEVGPELAGIARDGIVLEPSVVLQYGRLGSDLFIYVSRENVELRERLNRGLRKLYCSGEFQRLLRTHASTRDMWTLVRPDARRSVTLQTRNVIPPEEARSLALYGEGWKSSSPLPRACAVEAQP